MFSPSFTGTTIILFDFNKLRVNTIFAKCGAKIINVSETDDACKFNSELVCAINNYILCSINPERAYCLQNKKELPAFVFMKDESLKRPTSQTYEIVKMKPLADNQIEVYTQSVCDGNWFGLCQGNIIFVLQRVHDFWIVKDVYAEQVALTVRAECFVFPSHVYSS